MVPVERFACPKATTGFQTAQFVLDLESLLLIRVVFEHLYADLHLLFDLFKHGIFLFFVIIRLLELILLHGRKLVLLSFDILLEILSHFIAILLLISGLFFDFSNMFIELGFLFPDNLEILLAEILIECSSLLLGQAAAGLDYLDHFLTLELIVFPFLNPVVYFIEHFLPFLREFGRHVDEG